MLSLWQMKNQLRILSPFGGLRRFWALEFFVAFSRDDATPFPLGSGIVVFFLVERDLALRLLLLPPLHILPQPVRVER